MVVKEKREPKKPKQMSKETQVKVKQIDEAIEALQQNNGQLRDKAANDLLKLFRPLIVRTTQSLEKYIGGLDFDDIKPIVEHILVKTAMEYDTPRRDTQGKGKNIGAWSPNYNVYLKQNLYFFAKLELMKDMDGPGVKSLRQKLVIGNGGNYNQQFSVLLEQNIHPEYSDSYDITHINDILDYIEQEIGTVAREYVILKYLYRLRNYHIKKSLGISVEAMKVTDNLVRIKLLPVV